MSTEVAHYVVTAYPPGAVQCVAKGRFLPSASGDEQVAISKSRRLEFRSCTDGETPFPLLLSLTINGRITNMVPLVIMGKSLLFVMTHNFQYAVLGAGTLQPSTAQGSTLQTICSGKIRPTLLGKPVDAAPILALSGQSCLAMHLYDGFLTILPINETFRMPTSVLPGKSDPTSAPATSSHSNVAPPLLRDPFHLRMEEHNILDLIFLYGTQQLAVLHQDSYGLQHVVVYKLDIKTRQLSLLWKKQRVDGGSSTLIAVPPTTRAAASSTSTATEGTSDVGYLVVLGQRQITLLGQVTRAVPLPTCLILAYCPLPPSPTGHSRYLLADEFGNMHMLTVGPPDVLSLDTLGSTSVLASGMVYMEPGWIFCGSKLGDSLLLEIHPEPINDSYLSVLEEYTNLGPIVDVDMCRHSSPGVVTASGTSISGTLRLVRNGIGMKEFAAVELPGIQNMWAVRATWGDKHDSYLVQSFVAETRILGVAPTGMQDEEELEGDATLDEVILDGLDSSTASLYVCNIQAGDLVLQVTEMEIRVLHAAMNFSCIHTWTPEHGTTIAVAAANEAGQIVVALRGGLLVYLQVVDSGALKVIGKTHMTSEVSCLSLNPFSSSASMEMDSRADAEQSAIVAVGLWDDFTVRMLTLDEKLPEVLQIHLSTEDENESTEGDGRLSGPVRRSRNNMMARSLCLVTLDSTSINAGDGGVDMLFVGLGDGTLISFAVDQQNGTVAVRSKKEVTLGTQRINLIPLQTERGGTCVLATGDRPTVIYLAGGGTRNLTPKLCYSNVNLSNNDGNEEGAMTPLESIAVNVATPFVSPQLFDDASLSSKHYSLCVSDDSILRLGVIDDIQKLHVTTFRLGMAPRRVVHCPEGRLFAVGCIESGIKQIGSVTDEVSMGNCVRFLDDTTFEDIKR
jgi:DNA damage-binding protein 1